MFIAYSPEAVFAFLANLFICGARALNADLWHRCSLKMTCLSRSSSPAGSGMEAPGLGALGNRVEAQSTFSSQLLL